MKNEKSSNFQFSLSIINVKIFTLVFFKKINDFIFNDIIFIINRNFKIYYIKK